MPNHKRIAFQRAIGLISLAATLLVLWLAFTTTPTPAGPHPYPMIRAGGLFLVIIGSGIVVGALFPQVLWRIFVAGVVLASLALALTARPLTAPLGLPTRLQVGALVVAILVEIVLIVLLPRLFPPKDDRTLPLSVMLVVGIHFLIMALAFGPLIVVLGLLTIGNAGAGLWVRRSMHWHTSWFIDGSLKLGIGGSMMCFPTIGL